MNISTRPSSFPPSRHDFPSDELCSPNKDPSQCSQGSIYFGYHVGSPNSPDSDNPHQYCTFYVVELLYQLVDDSAINSTSGWKLEPGNPSTITCAILYALQPLNITIDVANTNSSDGIHTVEPHFSTSDHLRNYSNFDLSADLSAQLSIVSNGIPTPVPDEPVAGLLSVQRGNATMHAFLDPEILRSAASKAFVEWSVQTVTQRLRSPAQRTVPGMRIYQENRLHVRLSSVVIMAVAFMLLGICALLLLFSRPVNAAPRDPSSIATCASILTSSISLRDRLNDCGYLTEKALINSLRQDIFMSNTLLSSTIRKFTIEDRNSIRKSVDPNQNQSSPGMKWWRPVPVTIPFISWSLVLPTSIIVVLEVLQHISDMYRGLTDITALSYFDNSVAAVLSAMLMTITAITYSSIEFAMNTFAPFQALRVGRGTNGLRLLGTRRKGFPIWSTAIAFKRRSWAAALASVAASVGGLLTIVASGLYTTDSVSVPNTLRVLGTDQFAPAWDGTNATAAATAILSFERENGSYSSFTYDELVLPSFKLSADDAINATSKHPLSILLPARRAVLECTTVPEENISWVSNATVRFVAGLPSSCLSFKDGSNQDVSEIAFHWDPQGPEGGSDSVSVFYAGSVTWLNPDSATDCSYPYCFTLGAANNSASCPSIGFAFGRMMRANNFTSTENVTGLVCVQVLQEVQVNATFLLPNFTIPDSAPPLVDEGSIRKLSYQINSTALATISEMGPTDIGLGNIYESGIDPFYQAMLWGAEGIPADELIGAHNAERFLYATHHKYRKWMAQIINVNMRRTLAEYSQHNGSSPPLT